MRVKKSLIKIVCSMILGLAFSWLLIWIFSGPRLDVTYDFLMLRRKNPAVSSELVLIDTAHNSSAANIADPSLMAAALLTLTEFRSGQAVIQTSVLGISSGTGQGEEIISQVTDEFGRIEENIDNLFQGIRTGSISPLESELYVNELIGLINRGKDRLVDSVSEQELAGLRFFEEALRIKNDVWMITDFGFAPLQFSDGEDDDDQVPRKSAHTSYRPDADGALRRIAPSIYLEDGTESHYLMYDAIVSRLNPREIQSTDLGLLFTRMRGRGFENQDVLYPTDEKGALLLDGIGKNPDFRRFSLGDFVTYNDLDQLLFQKLEEMETLGYYDQLRPENHPTALYRYALAMKDDLLREPSFRYVEDWVEAREDYFDSVDDFFLSGTETKLVTGYEELIASSELDDSVKAELVSMRNALIKTFRECRDAYNDVSHYRENLKSVLGGAFCILGPLDALQSSWGAGSTGNPSETEAAAMFANAFLTRNTITPADDIQIVFWIFLWVFFLAFFVRNANALVTLLFGILASVLSIVFFSSLFVYWDIWIHPAIPVGTLLFSAFVSIVIGFIFKRRLALELRRAYGPYVSSYALKKIIKRTYPEPWETLPAYCAVIAVRSRSVHTSESKDSPVMAALAVRNFRDTISEILKDAGAVIIGSDGDLVLAAFGSPLERSVLWNAGIAQQYMKSPDDQGRVNPVDKVLSVVMRILKQKIDNDAWSFGIDCGECAFTYSDASGYSAFGHAVVKARLLSSLARKYQSKVLLSENAKTHTGLQIETRKLDMLVERELGTKEAFYALVK